MKKRMIKRGIVSFHDTNTERDGCRPLTLKELSSDFSSRLSAKAHRRIKLEKKLAEKKRNLNSEV